MMPLNEQRAVANVRERKRTQKLNQAYKQLQSMIPKEPSDKMSKIHTLKLALNYIDFLNNILKEGEENSDCGSSSGSQQEQHSTLKSPNASSSSSSYAIPVSAATSETEEEEYQHRSKRARFDSTGHDVSYGLTHQQIGTAHCYANTIGKHNEGFELNQERCCNSYSSHAYTVDNHNQQSSPTTSHQNYPGTFYTTPGQPTQITDDISSYLRNAFREYRTSKRKSQS